MRNGVSTSLTLALSLAAAALPQGANANQINTAGAAGAYHTQFCPLLETRLRNARFEHKCTASDGSVENLRRVAADPRQLGYAQLDVYALETQSGRKSAYTVIRTDDVRECVFLATRNKSLTSYGEVQAFAPRLRFILPPQRSGSAGTFQFLQSIDADGIAKAKEVAYAASADDAVRQAMSAEDTLTLFVQFPDADSAVFKQIAAAGGQIIPVIDRNILRQQVGDQKVYFAQETEVANPRWVKSGTKVVTACTPMVLFTGSADQISGDKAKQDHKDLIATIKDMKTEELTPQRSTLQRWLKRTKELSAVSVEKLMEATETARDQAKPMMEKAREATTPMIEKAKELGSKASEAAKPMLDKAKEVGQKALDKAKEEAKELMDKSKSGGDAPAEPKKQ